MPIYSPLRYPGGKRRLANFLKILIRENNLLDGHYIEPYAGGASVALELLFEEHVHTITINDLDRSIYSFWNSVINDTETFCKMIIDTPVTMDIWQKQKAIITNPLSSSFDLGFAAFYLNRTNRSGIITGGVIGGKEQKGNYKIDARFNKQNLIQRIQKIARFKNRINLYNLDAMDLLNLILPNCSKSTIIYLDPPYYIKGPQLLYANYYNHDDHSKIANLIKSLDHHWIISYDNTPQINEIYSDKRKIEYLLHYSAQEKYSGDEIIYFCDSLIIPKITDPIKCI